MSEPITDEILHQIADKRELTHRVTNGRLSFAIPFTGASPNQLYVNAGSESDGRVFSVRTYVEATYPVEVEQTLLHLANEFQREHRWPKVVVNRRGEQCSIHGEFYLPVETGTTPEQLDEVIAAVVTSSIYFWDWLPDRLIEAADVRFADDDWASIEHLLSPETE